MPRRCPQKYFAGRSTYRPIRHNDEYVSAASTIPLVSKRTSAGMAFLKTAVLYSVCFLGCAASAWRGGVFQSEFGRYQDEGMHYLTGLFVQDYLTSGHWSNPIQFARQYYLHYPKIAPGQWPPAFSIMQTAWALVFGVSRTSMMWGMIALTAWLALLVYRAGARYFGPLLGAIGAVLLIGSPLTQENTAMVMAEIPLAATSFLAVSAFARFLASARRKDALAFAAWTFAAIMTKGNAWVVVVAAPLILAATGRLRLLANRWLWISAGLIGLLCVPYTLITMRIVEQGWDTRTFPGWGYDWLSLRIHLGFVAGLLGTPLTVFAVFGAAYAVFRRNAIRWSERDPFWLSMAVYGIVIIVFHVAIPSSIEPRKIYQILPVMCLFVLAAIDGLAGLITKRSAMFRMARPAIGAAAVLLFAFTGFSLLPQFAPGFGPAVATVMARPESRGAAILVSSNPQWADSEAAIIAEWVERSRNDGTYLIRGTKLLSHSFHAAPGEPEFALNFPTQDAVLKALAAVPVSFVILHTTAARISYPHHALLKAALDRDPSEWERIYHTQRFLNGLGETHTIEIYRCRKNLAGVPIHYSVDLTQRVGTALKAEQ